MPSSDYTPEYPNCTCSTSTCSWPSKPSFSGLPSRFQPYLENQGGKRRAAEQCYLDRAARIPAPDIFAYRGVPQFQPLPVIGSHDLFEFRDNVCFDRYGRYGPYGLGYSLDKGRTGRGIPKQSDKGVDHIHKLTGRIDYRNVDWREAQNRCFQANRHRFITPEAVDRGTGSASKRRHRQAVIIRTYTGYEWTEYAILNLRAIVNEASLLSGGQYDVHLLLHVRDTDVPNWDDAEERQTILDANVPKEFHSLCTLWSEAQMEIYYLGGFGDTVNDVSGTNIHGVYRSGHMPLQHFAVHHPEYAHFWNWEVDARYIGSYYELFSMIGRWAQKQSRMMMWERSSTYYIPGYHGSWEDFNKGIERAMLTSGRQPILGPVESGTNPAASEIMEDYLPESCDGGDDVWQCGVDEPADLITLNPIFDVEGSGWVFSEDITGYETTDGAPRPLPPRRSAIVTASRLSRRLLNVMHRETMDMHHTMFTEMFPPSVALHYGLKAVYAPHPTYLDRAWPLATVNRAFNGGKDNTTSGPGSPFDWNNEHNHKGSTWYYHAEFAGRLWRRWLGLEESEDRGKSEGASRLCLRSMLVHPIKWEEKSD